MCPRYAAVLSATITLCHLLAVHSQHDAPPNDLTFAEMIYVQMSSACRAIVNLRYNTMNVKDDLTTMNIMLLRGKVISTYPIDTAFDSLSKPAVFDISKQTKIIIHGYKDKALSHVPIDLARAYDELAMFNVLLVDAEDLLGQWYFLSVHNARLVGKRLGNVIANLENLGASAEDFHLLGISLGAHVAGWAGKYFRQYKGRSLGRITGLDPAGPCFSYAFSDQRLDKMDASYVDVIHSNRLVQGVIESLGHADFYINGGGPNQPGCFNPTCSHLRAAQVYTESIRTPKSFVGVRCHSWKHFLANACEDDYAVLGYGSSSKSRGLYYLRTAENPPLGLAMKGVKRDKTMNFNNWLHSMNIT